MTKTKKLSGWLRGVMILLYIFLIGLVPLAINNFAQIISNPGLYLMDSLYFLVPWTLLWITIQKIEKRKKDARNFLYITMGITMLAFAITQFQYYSYNIYGRVVFILKFLMIPSILILYFTYSKQVEKTLVK
jgi:hypothetical protein